MILNIYGKTKGNQFSITAKITFFNFFFSKNTRLQILGHPKSQAQDGLDTRIVAQSQDSEGPQGEHFDDQDVRRSPGDSLMGPDHQDLEQALTETKVIIRSKL